MPQSYARTLTICLTLLLIFSLGSLLTQPSLAQEAWAEYDTVVIKPGDTATFNISLRGNDTYILSAEDLPEGWSVKFYYGTMEISSLSVRENKTTSIKMVVSTSQDTPPDDYVIYFVAESPITYSYIILPLTIKVRSLVRRVEVSASYPYLVKESGESLTYRLVIMNIGERDETLLLRSLVPKGWNYSFLLQDEAIYGLYLKAGSSQQVTVKFTPPEDVSAVPVSFTITVYSTDKAVNATTTLYADLIPKSLKREVKISATSPYLSKKAGESLRYSLTIINNGNVNEPLLLRATVPEKWKSRFLTPRGEGILGLLLEAGRSQEVIAEFTPLDDHWTGNVQFTVSVVSDDRMINKSIMLSAEILPKERYVEMIPLYQEITVERGQPFSIPVTISNKGEYDEQLTLNVDSPEGWDETFKLSSDATVKVSSIYLAAGSSKTLIFEAKPIRVPNPGLYTFTLKICSTDGAINSSYNLRVNVIRSSQPALSCQIPLKVTQPGSLAKFQVKVVNPAFIDQVFRIIVEGLPSGWNAKIKTADGESVSIVNVGGGSSMTLNAEFSVPNDANNGVYNITLKAESSEFSESIVLYVEVQSPPIEINLKAIPPYLDAYSGFEAQFKIQVLNSGGRDELLNITCSGLPEDFKVKFKDIGGNEITAIYVEAGASREFLVSVLIPMDTELGAKRFTVSLFNADVKREVDLTLNVLGFYKIEITTRNFYTTLNVGGEGTFTLKVKNTGSMDVTNVRVTSISVPEGFTINISPESIPSLKVNQEGGFAITVSSEPNVNAGNYYIDFNILSDQTEKLSFTLRVEVFQTINWLLYAGIGIVIALIFLFLIYRKFGRR